MHHRNCDTFNIKHMNSPTKVFIIEDHFETRSGISFIINGNSEFNCMSFNCAEDALEGMKHNQPQVVLMDINLPGMNGIECTRQIKQRYPSVLIMMCTVFEDSEKIFNALKAGANGYILKKSAGETLLEAIRELLRGGAPMSSDIARKVVNSFRDKAEPGNQD